jgi:hypothetical protein
MSDQRVHIPQWNHYPLLGWFHYRNKLTNKLLDQPNTLFLSRMNPYLGFINHAVVRKPTIVLKRSIGTQTDPDRALELGDQIIKKNGL